MMTQITSSTNFDLPALHVLQNEIDAILKDAEIHLRDFYDDNNQAHLLMDSAQAFLQLAKVFDLIYFDGAALLANYLAKTYTKINQNSVNGEEVDEALMIDVSEAIMLLDRYVEFVLLKETLEPALLLPIINKLREHLGQPTIDLQSLQQNSRCVVIHQPQDNFISLDNLDLDKKTLIDTYRLGLCTLLSHQNTALNGKAREKIQGMADVCQTIAKKTDVLFWQAAAVFTKNITQEMPLNHVKQRILIYIEQQLCSYLPTEDRRFAKMVSFARHKDSDFDALSREKYTINQLDQARFAQMHGFLFGPDHQITTTLNSLIQEDLESIKQQIDSYVRAEGRDMADDLSTPNIAQNIVKLSKALSLLKMPEASNALIDTAKQVNNWQSPNLEELDASLDKLMIAENAAIYMAKSHTPGALRLPIHNHRISLHQLDAAYEALVREAKINLSSIATELNNYLASSEPNSNLLKDTPEMIRQISGAMAFLRLPIISKQLKRLADKLEFDLLEKLNDLEKPQIIKIAESWADILVAADIQLENFTNNHPISKQAIIAGERGISHLLTV